MEFRDLLYRALQEPFGLAVEVSDPNLLRQKLYGERRNLQDPELTVLQFRLSPSSTSELWITKTTGRKHGTQE